MKRLYYLDNLKVCLTVLVIMHHAGQAYGNGGAWAYTPSNPAEFMPWIWHFFSTNAAFFMGLYFFISGYFVPGSYDKQGSKQFILKKLLRLGNGTGLVALLIGVGLAIGNYLRDGGAWNAFVWQWFGIYESLMCVFISFGLMWLFREFICATSRLWQWSAAQSYGAYVFHLILMIILQNAVDGIWMGAFGKFLFIGVVTTILSFLLTWVVRMIPGVKRVL